MVFFICEVCNECIKKPKVEQHSSVCRSAWVFCCMDCGERFEGPAYKAHTSCMSEAQRYEGKFYVPKENKGEKKQQSWMESVLSRLESADPKHAGLKPYMERLTQYDNLPRKKAKFTNFAKNSLNLKADREGIAEKLWGLIEDTEKSTAAETAAASPKTSATPTPAPTPASASAPAPAPAPAAGPSPAAAEVPKAKKEKKGKSGGDAAASPGDVVLPPDLLSADKAKEGKKSKGDADESPNGGSNSAKKLKKDKPPAEADEKGKSPKRAREDPQPLGGAAAADETTKDQKRPRDDPNLSGAAKPGGAKPGGATEGGAKLGEAKPGGAKPVKWKKIVAKELTSCGGKMNLKELRKAAVAEVLAHPSHTGRNKAELIEEFDREMPRFKRFVVSGNQVTFGPEQE
jgi:cell growth-regulating nucleolar protein